MGKLIKVRTKEDKARGEFFDFSFSLMHWLYEQFPDCEHGEIVKHYIDYVESEGGAEIIAEKLKEKIHQSK